MSDTACVFCEIVAGRSPARFIPTNAGSDVVAFHPLGPVVPGHLLFIPKAHVVDASTDPLVTARVMAEVCDYAASQRQPFNLITSAGREATQSVFHLHIHYVPRAVDDGLMAPWGTAWGENPQDPHRCTGMKAQDDLLEDAWGVIANAGGWAGSDRGASPGWLPAAERWRDRWFAMVDETRGVKQVGA